MTVAVDQVLGRPVAVAERVPRAVVVVQRHRIAHAQPGDRSADVVGLVLERELGRVYADDLQALVPVGVVPGTEVGQRAQAVDAGVRPEVDQHHLAAQAGDGERVAFGRVEPARDAGELRRCAEVAQALVAGGRVLPPGQPVEPAVGRRAALDPLLERLGVAGHGGLEAAVGAERDRERRHADHGAEHPSNAERMGPHRAHADRPAPARGDEEHRHGRSERVREREHDDVQSEVAARRHDGDGCKDGSGAGHKDEPECGAEQQSAAEVAGRPAAQAYQRPLEPLPQPWEEERGGDDEEQDQREVAEEVLRQPERVEQPDAGQREGGEARDQAGDDCVRPPPPARGAAREQDRQHRQDARRQRRDQPCGKADCDQDEHGLPRA